MRLENSAPTRLAAQLERTIRREFPSLWPVVRAQVLLARRVATQFKEEPSDRLARELRLCLESVQKVVLAEWKAAKGKSAESLRDVLGGDDG